MGRPNTALSQLKESRGILPTVKAAGCIYCWQVKIVAYTRACGFPNPLLIIS